MVIEARISPWEQNLAVIGNKAAPARLTVFHCINALNEVSLPESADFDIRSVKLPCSSLMREVVLLHAFEAGADAVLVFVCPEGSCRYLQGNLRAEKRVARVKRILDEIGINGRRLNIYSIPHGSQEAMDLIIYRSLADIGEMGPNPTRQD